MTSSGSFHFLLAITLQKCSDLQIYNKSNLSRFYYKVGKVLLHSGEALCITKTEQVVQRKADITKLAIIPMYRRQMRKNAGGQ